MIPHRYRFRLPDRTPPDLVEVVHRLQTLVNYKGVEKGNRRGKE